MEELIHAEYLLNRQFIRTGEATLNEFYDYLGVEGTKFGDVCGWSVYMGREFYGYDWIEFEHVQTVMDDGSVCWYIHYPYYPTVDYFCNVPKPPELENCLFDVR